MASSLSVIDCRMSMTAQSCTMSQPVHIFRLNNELRNGKYDLDWISINQIGKILDDSLRKASNEGGRVFDSIRGFKWRNRFR